MNRKYSIYLIIFFIILKIAYLIVESSYNSLVLDIANSTNIDEDNFHKIEILGHIVAAAGFTILFSKFIYNLYRSFFKYVIVSSFIFISSYFLLDKTIELGLHLASQYKEPAYYLALQKVTAQKGYIDSFGYIENDNSVQSKFINDTIILWYPLIDENDRKKIYNGLMNKGIAKMKQDVSKKERDRLYKIYYDKYKKLKNEIDNKYSDYKNISSKISYLENSKKNIIDKKYKEFMDELDKSYNKYKLYTNKIDKDIKRGIEEAHSNRFRSLWNKFEKNYLSHNERRREMALSEYNGFIRNKFGSTISPQSWCGPEVSISGVIHAPFQIIGAVLDGVSNTTGVMNDTSHGPICLNDSGIERSIRKLVITKYKNSTKYPINDKQPYYVSKDEFFKNSYVHKKYISILKNRYNLDVENDFIYSDKNRFSKYIEKSLNNKIDRLKKMKNKFKDGMTYSEFVYYKPVRNEIEKKINSEFESKIIIKFIANGCDFRKDLFEPIFTKRYFEQVMDSKEKYGDDALKYVMVPLIALSLSLLFGLLNMIMLIVYIIELIFKTNKTVSILLVISILSSTIFYMDRDIDQFRKDSKVAETLYNRNKYLFHLFNILKNLEETNYEVGLKLGNIIGLRKIIN